MQRDRKPKLDIVIILASGDSQRPHRLHCIYPYCGRTMLSVNRDIALVLEDNKGIHWADLPEDITVIEHKCRGCGYFYRIYTPQTVVAKAEVESMLKNESVV